LATELQGKGKFNQEDCTWTNGIAINPAGLIGGFDNDYANVLRGFVRIPHGK